MFYLYTVTSSNLFSISFHHRSIDNKILFPYRLEEDDPLWTQDSQGRGRYDTIGKKGFLLIVNYNKDRTGIVFFYILCLVLNIKQRSPNDNGNNKQYSY